MWQRKMERKMWKSWERRTKNKKWKRKLKKWGKSRRWQRKKRIIREWRRRWQEGEVKEEEVEERGVLSEHTPYKWDSEDILASATKATLLLVQSFLLSLAS